jgi:uncharacterized repeat protein (TIGR03803 family)
MQRVHVSIRIASVAFCALAVTACGVQNAGPPATTAPWAAARTVGPDTLHVVPLYQFSGHVTIIGPGGSGGLIGSADTALYGVSAGGGNLKCHAPDNLKGCGFIYELTPDKAGVLHLTPLHTFDGRDGAEPTAALFKALSGLIYGTTDLGGAHGKGTVFQLDPSTYAFTVLHSFRGGTDDGAYPYAGVIELRGPGPTLRRYLYGTTSTGGAYAECGKPSGCGVAYSIDETPPYSFRVIHSFGSGSDGAIPYARLIHFNGNLYGATSSGGGPSQCGTVFTIDRNTGAERVLWRFQGAPDGCNPLGGLVTLRGELYGTTYAGGVQSCDCGTIYGLRPTGTSTERVLHSFSAVRGAYPEASLLAVHDSLYGTTLYGGKCSLNKAGCGSLFRLTPSISGPLGFKVLHRFHGARDGAEPEAPLHSRDDVLYGTTSAGGEHGAGTAFRLPGAYMLSAPNAPRK